MLGFITKLANLVLEVAETNEEIKMHLQGNIYIYIYIIELGTEWEDVVTGILQSTNEREKRTLGESRENENEQDLTLHFDVSSWKTPNDEKENDEENEDEIPDQNLANDDE